MFQNKSKGLSVEEWIKDFRESNGKIKLRTEPEGAASYQALKKLLPDRFSFLSINILRIWIFFHVLY